MEIGVEIEIPQDKAGYRRFALVLAGAIALLFGILVPWLLDREMSWIAFVIAGVLAGWGVIAPLTLAPFFRLWMRLGLLLGRITTPIILGSIFLLLILPAAVIIKLMRRDTMKRSFDDDAESYRVKSQQRTAKSMEQPF